MTLRRPPGSMKIEFTVEDDVAGDAQARVEIQQVDAAAQQDVLAVVDGFAAGLIRSGAAAQERTGFQHDERDTRAAQRSGCRESGQSAADDDNIHRASELAVARKRERFPPPPPPLMASPGEPQHQGDEDYVGGLKVHGHLSVCTTAAKSCKF